MNESDRWRGYPRTLIYIRASLPDFALGAREGLVCAQLNERRGELRAPVLGVRSVLNHVRPGASVHRQLGVDAHQALLGQQVDVVVVVKSHGRLLVVPKVREVNLGGVRRASVQE